jgi:hypothetical protein
MNNSIDKESPEEIKAIFRALNEVCKKEGIQHTVLLTKGSLPLFLNYYHYSEDEEEKHKKYEEVVGHLTACLLFSKELLTKWCAPQVNHFISQCIKKRDKLI